MYYIRRLYKEFPPGSNAATVLYLNQNLRNTLLWSEPIALTKDGAGILNMQYAQSDRQRQRKQLPPMQFQVGVHNVDGSSAGVERLRDFPWPIVDNVLIYPARLPKAAGTNGIDYYTILLAPGTQAHQKYVHWCQDVLFGLSPAGTFLIGRPTSASAKFLLPTHHFYLPSRQNSKWVQAVAREKEKQRSVSKSTSEERERALTVFTHPEMLGLGVVDTIDAWHDICHQKVVNADGSPKNPNVVRSSPLCESPSVPVSYLEHRWRPVVPAGATSARDKIWVLEPVPFEKISPPNAVRLGYATGLDDYTTKLKIRKEFLRPHRNRNLITDSQAY